MCSCLIAGFETVREESEGKTMRRVIEEEGASGPNEQRGTSWKGVVPLLFSRSRGHGQRRIWTNRVRHMIADGNLQDGRSSEGKEAETAQKLLVLRNVAVQDAVKAAVLQHSERLRRAEDVGLSQEHKSGASDKGEQVQTSSQISGHGDQSSNRAKPDVHFIAWKCLDALEGDSTIPQAVIQKSQAPMQAHVKPPSEFTRTTSAKPRTSIKWDQVEDLNRSDAYLQAWSNAYSASVEWSNRLVTADSQSAPDDISALLLARQHCEMLPDGSWSGQDSLSSPPVQSSYPSSHSSSNQVHRSHRVSPMSSDDAPGKSLAPKKSLPSSRLRYRHCKPLGSRSLVHPGEAEIQHPSSSSGPGAMAPELSSGSQLQLGIVCTLVAAVVLAAAVTIGGMASGSRGGSFRYGALVSIAWAGMAFAIAVVSSCLWSLWQFALTMEKRAGGIVGQLNSLRQKGARATSTKAQFLASLSHEVRTPLNGMIGMLSTLEDAPELSPEVRASVDSALESSWRVTYWLARFVGTELGLPTAHRASSEYRRSRRSLEAAVRLGDSALGDKLNQVESEFADSQRRGEDGGAGGCSADPSDGFADSDLRFFPAKPESQRVRASAAGDSCHGAASDPACTTGQTETRVALVAETEGEAPAVVHSSVEVTSAEEAQRRGSGSEAKPPAKAVLMQGQGTAQGGSARVGGSEGQDRALSMAACWSGGLQSRDGVFEEQRPGGPVSETQSRVEAVDSGDIRQWPNLSSLTPEGVRRAELAESAASNEVGPEELQEGPPLAANLGARGEVSSREGEAMGRGGPVLRPSGSGGRGVERGVREGPASGRGPGPDGLPTGDAPREQASFHGTLDSANDALCFRLPTSTKPPVPTSLSPIPDRSGPGGPLPPRILGQLGVRDVRPSSEVDVPQSVLCERSAKESSGSRQLARDGLPSGISQRAVTADVSAELLQPDRTASRPSIQSTASPMHEEEGRTAAKAPIAQSARSSTPTPALSFLQNKRMLVVDDNAVNRKVVVSMLRRYKCVLAEAPDGKQALEHLTPIDSHGFACVFMDLQMPVMDGYEATREIRKQEKELEARTGSSRHIPIFAITADLVSGAREKCMQAGMDDFLTKPLSKDRLLETLNLLQSSASCEPFAEGGAVVR